MQVSLLCEVIDTRSFGIDMVRRRAPGDESNRLDKTSKIQTQYTGTLGVRRQFPSRAQQLHLRPAVSPKQRSQSKQCMDMWNIQTTNRHNSNKLTKLYQLTFSTIALSALPRIWASRAPHVLSSSA